MSATAMAVATTLTDLDPTGIATNILNIAAAIQAQYEQMENNKEACKDLYEQIILINGVVDDLVKRKQTRSCQESLSKLQGYLTECQQLIQSVSIQKSHAAFLSSESNEEKINKLTTQLRDMRDILNLALTTQVSNRIEENTGQDSEINSRLIVIQDVVQASSSAASMQLSGVQQGVSTVAEQVVAVRQQLEHMALQNQRTSTATIETFNLQVASTTQHIAHHNQLIIGQNPQDNNSQPLTPEAQQRQKQDDERTITYMHEAAKAASASGSKKVNASIAPTQHIASGTQVIVNTPMSTGEALTMALSALNSNSSSSSATAGHEARGPSAPKP